MGHTVVEDKQLNETVNFVVNQTFFTNFTRDFLAEHIGALVGL
jgi:hypothetical protein